MDDFREAIRCCHETLMALIQKVVDAFWLVVDAWIEQGINEIEDYVNARGST